MHTAYNRNIISYLPLFTDVQFGPVDQRWPVHVEISKNYEANDVSTMKLKER